MFSTCHTRDEGHAGFYVFLSLSQHWWLHVDYLEISGPKWSICILGSLHPWLVWFSLSFGDYSSQLKELLYSTAHNHSRCCCGFLIFGLPIFTTANYPLCTVEAMMRYFSIRGNGHGPLFLSQDSRSLLRSLLTNWVWQIMSTAGIHVNFSSHSFHIFAAIITPCNGIPDHLIQALGRWSSCAYQLYIKTLANLLPLSPSNCLNWRGGEFPLAVSCS